MKSDSHRRRELCVEETEVMPNDHLSLGIFSCITNNNGILSSLAAAGISFLL